MDEQPSTKFKKSREKLNQGRLDPERVSGKGYTKDCIQLWRREGYLWVEFKF